MPALKLKQIQYESDTWKRLLLFMMDENIYLKNRISELLRNGVDKNLLTEVEAFQNRFIQEDELISLLRNDVAELDKILEMEKFEDGKLINLAKVKGEKLRNNLVTAEKQLDNLKLEFNNFLSESA
jgi:hypothetical protein